MFPSQETAGRVVYSVVYSMDSMTFDARLPTYVPSLHGLADSLARFCILIFARGRPTGGQVTVTDSPFAASTNTMQSASLVVGVCELTRSGPVGPSNEHADILAHGFLAGNGRIITGDRRRWFFTEYYSILAKGFRVASLWLKLYRALHFAFRTPRVGLSRGRLMSLMAFLGAWMDRDSVRNAANLDWYWSVPMTG